MSLPSLDHAASSVLIGLAESSMRAMAVGAAMALALIVFRTKRATERLVAWTIVLYAALAMPVLGAIAPGLRWSVPATAPIVRFWPSAPAPMARTMVAGDLPAAPFASTPIISIAAPFAAPAPAPLSMPTPASRVARLAPFIASITTPIALVSLYLIGVAVLLFRVGLGMLVSGRLKRSAQPIDDERALDRLRVHLATCGLTHAPRLAETPRLFVPITMLVFQPVILLPCTWREWDAATLDAVLVHELSHVARRDALTQRLSLLYRAVFWCNPLSWWLHRRLTDLAEHASDEAALASGADQTEYAETLLGFFSLIDKGSRRADWHVAMARGAGAERRVDRIFAWTAGTSIKLRTSIVIAMIMVAAPIAMFAAAVRPSVIPVGAVARTAQLTLPSSPIVTAPARMTAATIHAQVSMPSSLDTSITWLSRQNVNGHRVWMIVFDTSSMRSQQDVQRAAAAATAWADGNVSPSDLVLVASIGPAVQVLQDFTSDQVKVHKALSTFGSEAKSFQTINDDVPSRDMKTICDATKPLQQKTSLLYVAGLLTMDSYTGDSFRAAASACSNPNVTMSVSALEMRGTGGADRSTVQTPVPLPAPAQRPLDANITPLTPDSVVGHRMWIILFDTSSMQPADVQKAAAAAIKWASEKMTSADLVLVASISSTIQVFQDFTTNPDKIRTALNTFASSNVSAIGSADSGATANNDARLIGLKVICDALKPIQQKKAMLYFSSGMTRSGADNQAQYRAATSACANANVMIDTVDARGLQAVVAGGSARQGTSPQPPGHVGLSMVAHQAGSPVTLLQSTSNATDSAYVSVLVRNDSNKTIRSITFATVFHLPTVDSTPNVDKSNSASKTYVMAGAALSTLIKPTESGPLRPGLIDLSRLNGLADHGGAEVELGVVRVEFDDGSVWTYDVVTKGHFESGGH